jgi:2-keto-4-pentenoate hydratase/2-oxohepta-3-ene-1,7-dioic acid hydratase in catechol pathway
MKLYTIENADKELVCVEIEEGKLLPLPYGTMEELIREDPILRWATIQQALQDAQNPPLALEDCRVLAPLPRPRQDIICLGMNYQKHKTEAEQFDADAFTREKGQAVYFSKRATYCPGPGQPIPGHFDLVDSLDYETELAVVIGKDAKDVAEADAYDYVLGYTILNDVSARNLQTGHKQWYFGKGLDGFAPMGPCIVTQDEFAQPPAQGIRTYINGELRQEAVTDELIFSIPHIIHELSQGMTLQAGTVIATGTPAGVGMGFDPPKFLKAGDVVTCQIDGIGTLENRVE